MVLVAVWRVLHSVPVYDPICLYKCVKTSDLCWKTSEEVYRPAKMASNYWMNLLQSSSGQLIGRNKPCCTASCLSPTLMVCHIHRAKPWIMHAVFQDTSACAGWVTADGKRSGGVRVRSLSESYQNPSCFGQEDIGVAWTRTDHKQPLIRSHDDHKGLPTHLTKGGVRFVV